ncbi:hypothetical protein [Schlesneria sp. T3-172]|uniref:hypothetical protein n=1 Tax=Schlesneria sphaerica TaxID=3373610 RepID=UPI0037C7F5E3
MTDSETPAATIAANYVGKFHMTQHRGVLPVDDGMIVFGNDGYSNDERSQREVSMVRDRLKPFELSEPEFAVSDDGYSWALVYSLSSIDVKISKSIAPSDDGTYTKEDMDEVQAKIASLKLIIMAAAMGTTDDAWQDANDLKKLDEHLNDE